MAQFPRFPERLREPLEQYVPGFYAWIVDITKFFNLIFTSNGDVNIATVGRGPVVYTPDGTKQYRLGVDNSGTPTATLIT